MRLFIAIEFTDAIKAELEKSAALLRCACTGGTFTQRENFHITLAFLGEIAPADVLDIIDAMDSCVSRPIPITIGRLGLFRRVDGDILWRAVRAKDSLARLQRDLTGALTAKRFVLEEENGFRPHLTLARQAALKEGVTLPALSEKLPDIGHTAASITLMQSQHIGGKLTYTPIYRTSPTSEKEIVQMPQTQIWQKPVFFRRNRVFRVYRGGKLFHDFMDDLPEDGFYPEEWIASAVRAINPGHSDPLEGISILEDGEIPFTHLLEKYPRECLGGRRDLGVLIKFLDSAIRLPMQVHPTRENAQRLFNSRYGKTEAWLILSTRPDACLYFGFSRRISRGEFERAVDRSETDSDGMTEFVNRVGVKPGDVFLVPAGVIHAIGAGCMLLEAQEPTDFTIQPERLCGEYRLSDEEMYLGLKRGEALECFDFDLYGEKVVRMGKKQPKTLRNEGSVIEELLIGPEDTPCFTMDRTTLLDGAKTILDKGAAVYIVVDGEGSVSSGGYQRAVKRGDYFFLPYAAAGSCSAQGSMQLICCKGGE